MDPHLDATCVFRVIENGGLPHASKEVASDQRKFATLMPMDYVHDIRPMPRARLVMLDARGKAADESGSPHLNLSGGCSCLGVQSDPVSTQSLHPEARSSIACLSPLTYASTFPEVQPICLHTTFAMRSPTSLTAILGFATIANLASARERPRWHHHKSRMTVDFPQGGCGRPGGDATATYDETASSTGTRGLAALDSPPLASGGTPPAFVAQPSPSKAAGAIDGLVEGDDGEAFGGNTGYLSSDSSTSGSASTSAAPAVTVSAKPGNATSADCKCGYSKGGSTFPQVFSIDFTTANTPAAISAAGMWITDTYEWQIGAVNPDGVTAYGQASNIRAAQNPADGIELVVPGGQTGSQVSGAEIAWQAGGKGMTKIYTEIEMQIDPTPGTCQSIVRILFIANNNS